MATAVVQTASCLPCALEIFKYADEAGVVDGLRGLHALQALKLAWAASLVYPDTTFAPPLAVHAASSLLASAARASGVCSVMDKADFVRHARVYTGANGRYAQVAALWAHAASQPLAAVPAGVSLAVDHSPESGDVAVLCNDDTRAAPAGRVMAALLSSPTIQRGARGLPVQYLTPLAASPSDVGRTDVSVLAELALPNFKPVRYLIDRFVARVHRGDDAVVAVPATVLDTPCDGSK